MSQCKTSVSSKEGEKCGVCDKPVGDKDLGIQCELCEKWWHAGCVKIPEDVYKALGKLNSLHWFCKMCNNSARKMFVSLSKLNDRVSQVELELKTSKIKSGKLNERIETIENLIPYQRKEIDGEIKTECNKLSDRVKKCEASIEQIDASFRNLVVVKLTTEVEKKVESFKEIIEQQLRDEMRGDIGDTMRSL